MSKNDVVSSNVEEPSSRESIGNEDPAPTPDEVVKTLEEKKKKENSIPNKLLNFFVE